MIKTLKVANIQEVHKVVAMATLYGLVTFVGVLYRREMIETDVAMLFLLLNILSASLLKPRNTYLMTIVGIVSFHYFILPDYSSFRFQNAQHIITFAVMAFSGIFASNITQSQRKQIDKNKRLQHRHKTNYQLARHLSALQTSQQIAQATIQFLRKEQALESRIYLAEPSWHLLAGSNENASPNVIGWLKERKTPPGMNAYWLNDSSETIGVLLVDADKELTVDPWVISLLSLSLTRSQATQALAEVEATSRMESMRTTLLASVSHDLKTPLGTIIGAATTLRDSSVKLAAPVREELLISIAEQGERLNRSLTKLLDITRYSAGALVPKREWVEPEEVIGSALQRLSARVKHHKVRLISEPMLVELDSLLFEQVVSNLIENAAKYSPDQSEIEIRTDYRDGQFVLSVSDQGNGIPEEQLTKIFERFYRLENSAVDGTGLGLAICQVIVQAHHGEITVNNREGGGSCFCVTIPCKLYDLRELYEQ